MIAHEWSETGYCLHCGTKKVVHETKAQNCVPRWNDGVTPRPTRTGQSIGDYAADDAVTIAARIKELEAERLAATNAPDMGGGV